MGFALRAGESQVLATPTSSRRARNGSCPSMASSSNHVGSPATPYAASARQAHDYRGWVRSTTCLRVVHKSRREKRLDRKKRYSTPSVDRVPIPVDKIQTKGKATWCGEATQQLTHTQQLKPQNTTFSVRYSSRFQRSLRFCSKRDVLKPQIYN